MLYKKVKWFDREYKIMSGEQYVPVSCKTCKHYKGTVDLCNIHDIDLYSRIEMACDDWEGVQGKLF